MFNINFIKLRPILLVNKINSSEHNNQTVNSESKSILDFTLQPFELCKQNKNESFLIFAYIMIKCDSFDKRRLIRETWANSEKFPNLITAFIIGQTNDIKINNFIQNEQNFYNDLIQGNFMDTYRNLTYKSLLAWKWITNNCLNAKLIVKIDDDLALNTNNLIKYFNLNKNSTNVTKKKEFFCNYCSNGLPIRDKNSKWHASEEEYNEKLYGLKVYPTFCYGPAYIMTTDLVEHLYNKSFTVKFFWLEDIYTALLAKDIKNVHFNQLSDKYIVKENIKKSTDSLFMRDVNSKDDFNLVMDYIKK